jgi:hypothetical protein
LSSSSSRSSSSSSSKASTGRFCFGEEAPLTGYPISWQTWSDGAAAVPTIIGDSDWGQLELEYGEQGRGPVFNFGFSYPRIITLAQDTYQDGQGNATLQIRSSNTAFLQDDILPAWEDYTINHNISEQYFQIRIIKQE